MHTRPNPANGSTGSFLWEWVPPTSRSWEMSIFSWLYQVTYHSKADALLVLLVYFRATSITYSRYRGQIYAMFIQYSSTIKLLPGHAVWHVTWCCGSIVQFTLKEKWTIFIMYLINIHVLLFHAVKKIFPYPKRLWRYRLLKLVCARPCHPKGRILAFFSQVGHN